jgi:tyrosine-protein phosphatase SIW14
MTRRTNVSLSVALFVASMCAFAKGQQPTEPPASPPPPAQEQSDKQPSVPAEPTELIGSKLIPEFGEVTPTLYRGGQPKKGGFEALAKMGVQIVVDLRGDRDGERQEVTQLGMEYVSMHWQCSFPKDRTFADFLTLIRKSPGKKIFVHCRVGDDRTGMMIAAYRMAEEGWSAERAKKEMVDYGFGFAHRRLICPRLADYEENFPNRFATKPEFEELRSAKQSQPAQEVPPSPAQQDPPTKQDPPAPPSILR